jgi:hypothetical protein
LFTDFGIKKDEKLGHLDSLLIKLMKQKNKEKKDKQTNIAKLFKFQVMNPLLRTTIEEATDISQLKILCSIQFILKE